MKRLLLFCSLLLTYPCIASAAERIISLAPHATELAFAAGLGDKLIAVSEFSDYPEQAKMLPTVANFQAINIERIVRLQPDLVIAWPEGNALRELEKLTRLGIPIFYSHPKQLLDIADEIEQLSHYAKNPAVGLQAAKDFRQQLDQLHQRYAHLAPTRYFYQLSEKPIITLAQDNWPSEIFRVCGGENVFQNSPSPYPQVSIEQVLLAQPEVIFTSQHAMRDGTMWNKWREQLMVGKPSYIWPLNPDWLNRPTPRTLMAIEQVCGYFEQKQAP
ncbi:vitamin B12 ABC transporter substrate-binding protein BtuF [Vibrio sp.]|uniref:vitamin B12 ABC transporter substrate-binding protein BtuF n=1 Tax=Vibrio sp. TaxID=678 RepID=UPI003D0A94AD